MLDLKKTAACFLRSFFSPDLIDHIGLPGCLSQKGMGKAWGLVVAPEQPPSRFWAASCAKRFDHFCVKSSVRQILFVDPPSAITIRCHRHQQTAAKSVIIYSGGWLTTYSQNSMQGSVLLERRSFVACRISTNPILRRSVCHL